MQLQLMIRLIIDDIDIIYGLIIILKFMTALE